MRSQYINEVKMLILTGLPFCARSLCVECFHWQCKGKMRWKNSFLYTLVSNLKSECYSYRVWGTKFSVSSVEFWPQLQLNSAHQSTGDIYTSRKLFISIPAPEACCPESFVFFFFKIVLSAITTTICRSKCSLEDTKVLWPEICLRK